MPSLIFDFNVKLWVVTRVVETFISETEVSMYLSQAVKLQDLVKGSGLLLEKQLITATSALSSCLRHLYTCVWIPKNKK